MAKCSECGGTGGVNERQISEEEWERDMCPVCWGTGTEPQEVAKVELSLNEHLILQNALDRGHDNKRDQPYINAYDILEEAINTIIADRVNTAVLAERDRIMADATDHYWDSLAKDKDIIIKHLNYVVNGTNKTEVKKIIRGV